MQTEYELRILNVDKADILKRLGHIGARKIHDEQLQRRWIMDFSDNRLWRDGGWVRVRKVGDLRTELSYKQRSYPHAIDSSKEIYLEVNDGGALLNLLQTIGLEVKKYQENKRLRYALDDIVFDLDTWPGKKPYLEIESKTAAAVRAMALRLGFTEEQYCYVAGPELHRLLGFTEDDMKNIRFSYAYDH